MTKPSLRLAVVLLALTSPLLFAQQASSPAAAAKAPAFKAHVLTVSELNALIAKPDQLLFLDVRRPGRRPAVQQGFQGGRRSRG